MKAKSEADLGPTSRLFNIEMKVEVSFIYGSNDWNRPGNQDPNEL